MTIKFIMRLEEQYLSFNNYNVFLVVVQYLQMQKSWVLAEQPDFKTHGL